jgi:hypothetical protein
MARINELVEWPTKVQCVKNEHRFTADALWIRLEVLEELR